MSNYIKVEGNESLVRDPSSGAILNTSQDDYHNHLRKTRANVELKKKLNEQTEEINSIKEDISEIKRLLYAILADK